MSPYRTEKKMEVERTTTQGGQDVVQAEGGEAKEMVNFTLNFKKEKYEISWPWDDKIGNLRAHITQLTGVPIPLQKLMVKGTLHSPCARKIEPHTWCIQVP